MMIQRRQLLFLFLVMLIMVIGAPAAASDREAEGLGARLMADNSITGYFEQVKSDNLISRQVDGGDKGSSTFDLGEDPSDISGTGEKKSVQKAFLLSLVIPGAGQFYNGSKLKALLFAGIEAISWYGYATYQSNGDDKTVVFEAFANEHWSRDDYAEFLETVPLDHHFTHTLPGTNTQQYYEMIGKYDQFVYGWDDATPLPRTFENHRFAYSQNRLDYEDMRYAANNEYDKSTKMIVLAMVNHLASGVEAALAAKRHNNRVESLADRLSFKARLARLDNEQIPMLTVSYKF